MSLQDRSGLIDFRCVAAAHQHPGGRTTDTLTVHERKWAFCPLDVRAKGHEWSATGGVGLETLRRSAPTIDLDAAMRDAAEARPPVAPAAGAARARAIPRKRVTKA